MKLDDLLKFNGRSYEFENYQKLLDKQSQLEKSIRRLSDKIQDEEDSLSVFDGQLNERDTMLYNQHLTKRCQLISKRNRKETELNNVSDQIRNMQR